MTITHRARGTIRRTGPGQWATIDNDAHRSEGIDRVEAFSTHLVVHFTFTGDRVLYGACNPDETLAAVGIGAGPSVGLSFAVVKFGRPSGLINPDTITNANANLWVWFELESDEPEVVV